MEAGSSLLPFLPVWESRGHGLWGSQPRVCPLVGALAVGFTGPRARRAELDSLCKSTSGHLTPAQGVTVPSQQHTRVSSLIFFPKYLFERITEKGEGKRGRQREGGGGRFKGREKFHPLVHCPNAWKSQGGSGPSQEPGTPSMSPIWVAGT